MAAFSKYRERLITVAGDAIAACDYTPINDDHDGFTIAAAAAIDALKVADAPGLLRKRAASYWKDAEAFKYLGDEDNMFVAYRAIAHELRKVADELEKAV